MLSKYFEYLKLILLFAVVSMLGMFFLSIFTIFVIVGSVIGVVCAPLVIVSYYSARVYQFVKSKIN